jgi:drug/metabolite transporter (DMT)-like permease
VNSVALSIPSGPTVLRICHGPRTLLALWLIRSEIPDRRRSLGLVVGFAGVVALLGIDVRGDAAELPGAGAVILSALGYAGAALLYRAGCPARRRWRSPR